MPNVLTLMLVTTALVAGLIFPPLSSYTAVYVTLAAMLLGAVLLGRRLGDIVRHPAYLAIWLAMALFAVTLPFVWNGADDLLIVLIVLPLALGIGLVALVEVEPRFASPTVIGGLCLFGAIGAMAAGFNDIYVDGLPRAGGGNNPIHFASLSMTLGFFSLIGLFGTRSRWRLVFLVGPLLGLEAVLLSATRGGVLAFALVGLLVALLFAVWLRRSARYLVAGAAVLALAGAAVIVTTPDVTNRALQAFSDADAAIVAFFSEDGFDEPAPNVDPSTDQRIALYRGALGVFRDNPVFGVGTSQIIPAAREFFPERYKQMGNHLHSDLGDYAAAAGIFGLAGYLLLLLAPFLRPAGNDGPYKRRALLLGAVVLSGSYFGLGLTNAVFGVLPQTVLYAVLLACLVAIGRVWDGNAMASARQ